MFDRHPLLWRSGGLLVLTGVLCGCSSDLSVTETALPPVSVSQPVVRGVVDYDDFEGYIAADRGSNLGVQEVRARVRGHLVKIAFEDGQMVKKGDLLFEIDPQPYKANLDAAEAQKAAAEAALTFAKAEYERTRGLVAKNAASREELAVWTAKQDVAKADVQKADAGIEQASLDLGYTKVTAPLNGKVSRALVAVGELVNAGGGETLLTTITPVDPMYVYFDVSERALLQYRRYYRKDKKEGAATAPAKDKDQKEGDAEPSVKDLKIPVFVALEGEEGYPHQGVIEFVDNRANPATGTFQVRGVLPNGKRILDAGMRARVRVPVSDRHNSLMITERAVGTDQGLKFVYVVTEQKDPNDPKKVQHVVERRDVKLGRLHDGLQVVERGLKESDWVIVNGIQRVRDGAKVDPKQVPMPGAASESSNQVSRS